MRRRATPLIFVLAAPLLTTGCGTLDPSFAQLFGLAPSAAQTAAIPVTSAPKPVADRVVVRKNQRVLELQRDGKAIESFPIALGAHSRGSKYRQGDGRTPEGSYRIDWRSMNTKYTRELHISYPTARERARAQADHVDPGGGIFIHAMPADYGPYDPPFWVKDWTEGCIAVGNAAIVKIWDAVPDGTPIDIEP